MCQLELGARGRYYQLLRSGDGGESWEFANPSHEFIFGNSATHMVPLHLLHRQLGTLYMVRACSLDRRDSQPRELVAEGLLMRDDAIGYVKATNNLLNRTGDEFGHSVALSADGETLAVGVWRDDSAGTGDDGIIADDSLTDAGAVYVFTRNQANAWSRQAYPKVPFNDEADLCGASVALSADRAPGAGAVYLY